MTIFEMKDLTKSFGGLMAVNRVSLHINQGEILGLIGPNGSGKTTAINTVTGIYRSDSGRVIFSGEDITNIPPPAVTTKGLARTFQGGKVFPNLSLLENIIVGRHCRTKGHLWGAIFRNRSAVRELEESEQRAMDMLKRFGLSELKDLPVVMAPFGYQALIGIAIALATEPQLLFLDEPMAGMNPQETTIMMDFIRKVRDSGVTIMLVEHNMKAIMGICERIAVLNYGVKIAEGSPEDICRNQEVIEAYLGGSYVAGTA